MKLFRPIAILFIVVATIASCKKENTQSANVNIKLTATDNGKVVAVSKGQTISITLGSPGDGGYSFNNWQYDNTVLTLNSHNHINPTNPNLVGDFGSDVWVFSAIKTGTSTMLLTASRGTTSTVTSFNGTVSVK